MLDQLDAKSWPEWLVVVACGVGELVAKPVTMDRFRRMLRDWKAEHEARGPKSSEDKRGNVQYNPVELLPVRGMTLPEKYAVLAAIHDAICEQTKRIDPWTTQKRIRNFRSPKVRASWSYAALCGCVAELGDGHRERITGVLRDVGRDLATTQPDSGVESLIDRMAKATAASRLSDDERRGLRAYLKLQRDTAGRNRRRELEENLPYNDELRRMSTMEPPVQPAEPVTENAHGPNGELDTVNLQGFRCADWFGHEHGIRPSRLSEAAKRGIVRTVPAPRGYLDSQGRKVRILYHEAGGLEHCSPKHVKAKTGAKLGCGDS